MRVAPSPPVPATSNPTAPKIAAPIRAPATAPIRAPKKLLCWMGSPLRAAAGPLAPPAGGSGGRAWVAPTRAIRVIISSPNPISASPYAA
ncbi:hypothetical protein [Xenorhabdus bovienii]|uniref:hypothetical protein n=1 Tax=Xenorhabdus bovienii TaxID=40576 RepID=UPI00237D1A80|nr:hypothetical protein [Xenorhabdus bovienii]